VVSQATSVTISQPHLQAFAAELASAAFPPPPPFAELHYTDDVASGGELTARYVLALDDGTQLYVVNRALRRASPAVTQQLLRGEVVDPSLVYFRCTPRFEAPPGPWRWLMEHVFVGTGIRRPDCVEMDFYRVP
jgi:hypothetical protein